MADDPQHLSNRKKTVIMGVLLMCSGCPGLYTTICFPSFPTMVQEFQVPSVVVTLMSSLFILFSGLAPVVWASLSEHLRVRQRLLLAGLLVLTLASIGLALMTNMVGLVVLRCVQSVGAASTFAVGSGIVADCFPLEQRGMAMSIFLLGVYFGPLLGPVIGGALAETALSWRATFWFCSAYGLTTLLLVALLLPETYRHGEAHDAPRSIMTDIARPLLMLRHPHVLLASAVFAVALSCLLSVEAVLPVLLSAHYGFSARTIGLSYLGSGVGNLLGALMNAMVSDRLLVHARRKRPDGRYKVEDRLSMHLWPCGLVFMPVGMLMVGWGIETNQSYWTAIVGFGIQAFGSQQIITSVSAYLIDTAPDHGASVSASSNLVGLIMSSVLSTCANPMALAIGAGFTLVFFTALTYVAMAILLCLKTFGERLRRTSGFDPTEQAEKLDCEKPATDGQ